MDKWLAQSTSDLLIMGSNPDLAIFFLFIFPKLRQKVSLGLSEFWWVKLELTDFKTEEKIKHIELLSTKVPTMTKNCQSRQKEAGERGLIVPQILNEIEANPVP